MIMPRSGFGYGRSLPSVELESFYKQSINFWITDKGELIQCTDHETEAGDYTKRNSLLLKCVDWMKVTPHEHRDYRSFALFKLGWIRLTTGKGPEDGFGLSISNKGIDARAFDAFSKCLNMSFARYCMIDIHYEDNTPETSTTYNSKDFSRMLRELKMHTWLDA